MPSSWRAGILDGQLREPVLILDSWIDEVFTPYVPRGTAFADAHDSLVRCVLHMACPQQKPSSNLGQQSLLARLFSISLGTAKRSRTIDRVVILTKRLNPSFRGSRCGQDKSTIAGNHPAYRRTACAVKRMDGRPSVFGDGQRYATRSVR